MRLRKRLTVVKNNIEIVINPIVHLVLMKKSVVLGVFLLGLLVVSLSFFSAGWFSNLFGKVTGNVVATTSSYGTQLKIVSYNINGGAAYKPESWRLWNSAHLAGTLSKMRNLFLTENPDILFLQEVPNKWLNDINRTLYNLGYIYSFVDTSFNPSNNYGPGIYSKYPFVKETVVIPAETNGISVRTLLLRVRVVFNGRSYFFYNVHILTGSDNQLVREWFRDNVFQEKINANVPHFISGDFNGQPLNRPSTEGYEIDTTYLDGYIDEDYPYTFSRYLKNGFYNRQYINTCTAYNDPSCNYTTFSSLDPESSEYLKNRGKIDNTLYRDYAGKKTIYLEKTYVPQQLLISDHKPVFSEYFISNFQAVAGDFDGDRKTDVGLFNFDTNRWSFYDSNNDPISSLGERDFGFIKDYDFSLLSGDYNGDGKSDLAHFRSSNGQWEVRNSNNNVMVVHEAIMKSGRDIIPVEGDYNGDGRADLTLYDRSTSKWYIWNASNNIALFSSGNGILFGKVWSIPVSGDYNGDGKSDLALYDPELRRWTIKNINSGKDLVTSPSSELFGAIPISGDYNGDGKSDLVLYNPVTGLWQFKNLNGQKIVEDKIYKRIGQPISGDYNGDGKSDLALYDISTHTLSWSNLIAPCAPSSWTPLENTVCSGTTFTQTSNCGTLRSMTGTKNCNVSCAPSSWTPLENTVCSGTTFTQTSNCGTIRSVTGTKSCNVSCAPSYSDWSDCNSTGIQTRTVLENLTLECTEADIVLIQSCEYMLSTNINNESIDMFPSIPSPPTMPSSQEIMEEGKDDLFKAEVNLSKGEYVAVFKFKIFFRKVLCKVAHPFSNEEYAGCLNRLFN